MKKTENIYKDKFYIPELLKDIKDNQLKLRLEHELYTYAIRALFYKRIFYLLSFVTISFPAIITIVNVFSGSVFSIDKLIVTILSAISTIAAGVLGIANVRENWISYRSNCELLKEEVFKYLVNSEPYHSTTDEEKRKSLFEENIIKISRNESISWWKNNAPK